MPHRPRQRPTVPTALLLLGAFSSALLSAQTLSSVTSVRHWSLPNATRIAIELSAKSKWRSERIPDPPRLFVDLAETKMALGDKGIHRVNIGDAFVKQVRIANPQPRTTRIVLDLEQSAVDFEISELSSPPRLMIEIRPKAARKDSPVSQAKPPAEPTKAEPTKAEPPRSEVVVYTPKPEPAKPVEPAPTNNPAPTTVVASAAANETTPPPAPREPIVAQPRAVESAPKPARPTTSAGKPSLTRALGLKLGRIVIDPGHGGHDQGTAGATGLLEKELVLDVSLRLGALLEQRLGSTVLYTRTEDVFIPLEDRTAFANQHRADLFVSVHANSSPLRSASGAEVFYLNFTTSKDALEVAARENAGHGKSIFELREIIQKIALKDKIDESRDFAGKVQNSLHSTWSKMNPKSRNRGVKQAPFIVLIGANMPSILTEIGFVSNLRDESLMKKPEHRQRIAEALFKGISNYADTLSRMELTRTGAAQN